MRTPFCSNFSRIIRFATSPLSTAGVFFPTLLLLLLIVPSTTATAEPDSPLQELQNHNETMYQRMKPSVISITCEVKEENNPKQGPYIGTGVIISSDGYILSNTSVVPPGAEDITIIFPDQTEKDARLIGASLRFEIALLKMEGDGYQPLPVGDSRKVSVGDQIFSSGNAFGLAQRQSNYSFSTGIISGIYETESVYWQSQYEGLQIEADSSINPGVDGGPIVNLQGELIGIVSLTADRARWLGMATPTHLFMTYISVLKSFDSGERDPTVDKPYLGVELSEKQTPETKNRTEGVVVTDVTRKSPAWYAGFRTGDVVYSAAGREIDALEDMTKVMKTRQPGDQFLVFIQRGHQKWSLLVRVGAGPF